MPDVDRRPANLTAILLLLGIVVGSIWSWKHLSPDTQDMVLERAVPVLALVAVGLIAVWLLLRNVRIHRQRRRRQAALMAQFQRETTAATRLDLAFALIELNGYRVAGIERVAPSMKELFLHTMATQKSDKQHRVRGMAASHLGVVGDHSVVPALLAALDDEHAYVRSCAALGLGRLRAVEAREKLTKMMEEDWDQTVRSRSREALERIG